MPKAVWQGVVVAEAPTDRCITVEGNTYFPPDALNRALVTDSPTTTVCSWKGTAHYYSLQVNGQQNPDAVWYYPDPKPEAAQIRDHVAFWKGVQISE